jgi:hypothetical protein
VNSATTDTRILRLAPEDNAGVVTTTIDAGEPLTIAGASVTISCRIPTGHKIALVPIAPGQKVLKYGAPIGSATCAIQPGEYVHTHNVKSDYLPTYTRDEPNPHLSSVATGYHG